MSADNGIFIQRDKSGLYTAINGSMSSDEAPRIRDGAPRYENIEAAMDATEEEERWSEYGYQPSGLGSCPWCGWRASGRNFLTADRLWRDHAEEKHPTKWADRIAILEKRNA